jgi:hypothetical protein
VIPHSRFIAALVLGLMVCAGCDGSDSDEEIISADATAACLTRAGVVIDKGPALIAGAGSNTGLRGLVGGRELVVVFHRNASDAKETEGVFEMLNEAADRNPALLSRSGNAVVFWKQRAPTAEEQATLRHCLRSR